MHPIVLLALVGAVFWLERRRPLRARVDPGPRRIGRNLTVAAITAVAVVLAERPLITRLARHAGRRGWGLVPRLGLEGPARTLAILLLMDYSLYWWHVLLHRLPLLWRCHRAHHADLDLDASTAARFHFAEFLLSIPWRAAQAALIGVSPRLMTLWGQLTFAEVVFHHSNLRLPVRLERALSLAVMTPRLHGIHHSRVRTERDANFSSGLTLWDIVHRTLRDDVRQEDIAIGLAEYPQPKDVTVTKTLTLPFRP